MAKASKKKTNKKPKNSRTVMRELVGSLRQLHNFQDVLLKDLKKEIG